MIAQTNPSQSAIQLKPPPTIYTPPPKLPKNLKPPNKMIVLIALALLIVVVILVITFLPSRQKKETTSAPGPIPSISPFPENEINLPNISDPTLKAINDRITKFKEELANPFNYQELLSAPPIDFNISF